jgi:preprotein translocase subunit SecE
LSNTKKKEITQKAESLKDGIKTYLKGVRSEWGKITWPERRQIVVETFVVLGVVFFFTLVVFILDRLFQWVLGLIPSR